MPRDINWLVPALVIAAVTTCCALLVALATGFSARPNGLVSLQVATSTIAIIAVLRVGRRVYELWRSGSQHPTSTMLSESRGAMTDLLPTFFAFGIIAVFLYSITFLKSMMSTVVPFWADDLFSSIDRLLQVDGQATAQSLQPVIGGIGIFYGLWQAVHLGGILWVLHWQGDERARYILSFMLTWAFGMMTAYVFSSAGPIFTGRFDPGLAPESMRDVAKFLWSNYTNRSANIGAGISAFPSMHVAISAWFASVLAARGIKWIGQIYVAAMVVCSVVLGWHYAVDGLAGIVIALIADRVARYWLSQRLIPIASR